MLKMEYVQLVYASHISYRLLMHIQTESHNASISKDMSYFPARHASVLRKVITREVYSPHPYHEHDIVTKNQ